MYIRSMYIPQILIGASSSSKLGCWRKISLEAKHNCLISASESWTCFPGRANRTSVSRRIMSSSTASSITWTCPWPCALIDSDQQQQQRRIKGVVNEPSKRVREWFVLFYFGWFSLCLPVTVYFFFSWLFTIFLFSFSYTIYIYNSISLIFIFRLLFFKIV